MSNKDFQVRHGLVVGSNVLVANSVTGNVGIGVSDPSFKFHVNGAVSVESLRISGTNLVSDLISSNNYAGEMANSVNAYVNTSTLSSNSYAGIMSNSSNSYAGAMANSSNGYAEYVGASGNAYVNLSTDSANSYAGAMANAANSYTAATYLPFTGGTISGDITVQGNAVFSGKTTYVNTQTLLVGDNIFVLNADLPNNISPSEDAGILVNRGSSDNVSIYWNEGQDLWLMTAPGQNDVKIASNIDISNAETRLTAAYGVANAAYGNSNSVAISANAYAGVMANSSNGYAEYVGASGNAYVNLSADSANSYAGSMANSSNNYAGAMANSSNGYVNSSTTAANNYAGQMANAANAYAASLTPDLTAANNWANSIGTYANNYAGTMANAANAYAAALTPNLSPVFIVANNAYDKANTTAKITVGNTAPVSPQDGDLWWNSDAATLLIRFSDADSSQWVEAYAGTETLINDIVYTAYDQSNIAFNQSNTAISTVGTAFDKANSANLLAYNTGIGANSYAGAMANAANSYVDNNYLNLNWGGELKSDLSIKNGSYLIFRTNPGNTFSSIATQMVMEYGNNFTIYYAGNSAAYFMPNGSFGVGSTLGNPDRFVVKSTGSVGIGTVDPSYKLDVTGIVNASAIYVNGADAIAAGNNYAGSMSNSSNLWANAVGTAGNNYTIAVGAAANTWANTKIANTSGVTTAGDFNVSGILTTQNALRETRVAIAASNIDLGAGNYFTKTISGTTTFTVSNTASSGTVSSFILDLTNGGSATVNWWATIKWGSGLAPTLTSSGRDVIGFFTHDGGTTWTGIVMAKDAK